MDRQNFIKRRSQYLTAAPIQSAEHLKGRDRALRSLVNALEAPSRHAFIYGHRGVGKSSLAHTAAYQLQTSLGPPILLACDAASTFETVCRDILVGAFDINPLEKKGQARFQIQGGMPGILSASYGRDTERARQPLVVGTVNEAITYLKSAVSQFSQGFTIVLDEFDQLSNPTCHKKFATLIKQLSDQRIPIRIIFVGIAETIDSLFAEHESIFRQVHSEEVERLLPQACLDILTDAEAALEIRLKDSFRYRIAQISDGFPYFVHLMAEKIFTASYDVDESTVSLESYHKGLEDALASVEFSFKKTYDDALHRNTKKYEHVTWAAASDKLLDVNVEQIWLSYQKICSQIDVAPVKRANMQSKLSQLTTPQYSSILKKTRRSNYTFAEKMMRAYARLRAAQSGCILGPENSGA